MERNHITPPAPQTTSRILVADASLLVIIDAQAHFFNKLDRSVAEAVTQRIAWLTALAA